MVRLVAAALADQAARQELRRSFSSSPVLESKLHIQAYLTGQGGPLLSTMARAGRSSSGQVLNLIQDMATPLEMYFPVPSHRRQWRGGRNLIVAIQMDEEAVPFGVDLDGRVVPLSPTEPPTTPTLMIVPAESFGRTGTPLRRSLQRAPARLPGGALRTLDDCPPGAPAGCDGGGGGGDPTPKTWQRGIGVDEYIQYMRAWNDHEPWTRGAPEFSLFLVGTAGLSQEINITEDTWNGSNNDENAEWNAYHPFSLKLITWDVDYGTRVRVECLERDAPESFNFQVSGNTKIEGVTVSFSGTFEREGSDDRCGRSYVTARFSTGEWETIPNGNPPRTYDGTSDLQWKGYGYN